jgi:hypothetical protein
MREPWNRQRASGQKPDPIGTHAAHLRHGEEQQVQLLQALRHVRQKTARLPACLRSRFGIAVLTQMIDTKQIFPKLSVQIVQGELGRVAYRSFRGCITG